MKGLMVGMMAHVTPPPRQVQPCFPVLMCPNPNSSRHCSAKGSHDAEGDHGDSRKDDNNDDGRNMHEPNVL